MKEAQISTAASATIVIAIFAVLSKLLGFVREMLIAARFGSGMETDTYFIAFTAAGLLGGFVNSAISTTFIPIITDAQNKHGTSAKIKHTNNLLNIVLLVMLLLSVLTYFLAPYLVKLLAYSFSGGKFAYAVKLTRIGLPMIIISGAIGVMTGYLHSEQRFTVTAMIGFPFNFVYIIFLFFGAFKFGIVGLMLAGVIAMLSQLFIQVIDALRAGFRYQLIIDFHDEYVKKVIYLSMPVLIGGSISSINTIIDRTLASSLVEGSISALNYADKLNGLVYGILILSIVTVLYPVLSQEVNKLDYGKLKEIIIKSVNVVLLISIPATVGLIILAKPIVELAFERGAFDGTATIMTTGALIFYAIGIVGVSLRMIFDRVYYSMQDTKTPMLNGIIAIIINIILNLILIRYLQHMGLALATSISMSISSGLLLYGLRKRLGAFGFIRSIHCGIKSALAAIGMGIAVYFTYRWSVAYFGTGSINEMFALFMAIGIGVIIYVLVIYLLKVDEVKWLISIIKR